MLLNKVPVLDKGYVALVDCSNTTRKLRDIGQEFFDNGEYPTSLEELGTLTLVIKCPLFVQLNISKFNLKIINVPDKEQHAYSPSVGEIGSPDRTTNEEIAADISRTTSALLINPKAYQADGCDRFVSQIITPINVYTTIIVHGSYNEWCKFACQQGFTPGPIKAYHQAIEQIITSEWM
jgi:hypothetical protein